MKAFQIIAITDVQENPLYTHKVFSSNPHAISSKNNTITKWLHSTIVSNKYMAKADTAQNTFHKEHTNIDATMQHVCTIPKGSLVHRT